MDNGESRKRRRYSRELKAQILAECEAPGASVAKVALSHGINANVVHGWRKLVREATATPAPQSEFVPVAIAGSASEPRIPPGIEIELRRGAVTIRLTWPAVTANELAAWMRELLR